MNRDYTTAFSLVLLAMLVVIVIAATVGWKKDCEEKGGHMVYGYKSGLCVSGDGRILE